MIMKRKKAKETDYTLLWKILTGSGRKRRTRGKKLILVLLGMLLIFLTLSCQSLPALLPVPGPPDPPGLIFVATESGFDILNEYNQKVGYLTLEGGRILAYYITDNEEYKKELLIIINYYEDWVKAKAGD